MDKFCLCNSQISPTCYVCQYCFKLFHKRCVMKKKTKFKISRDHIVICSDCKDKDQSSNGQEWEKTLLEQTIEELTFEAEAKGKQLERVIFDKDNTLQEAIKTEEELSQIIQEQEKTLQTHLSQIHELEALIRSLKKNTTTKGTQTTTFYRNTKTQTDTIVKTTETQTQHNKCINISSQTEKNACTVDTQTYEISTNHTDSQLETHSSKSLKESSMSSSRQSKNCCNTKKLLLLCDEKGRNIQHHLRKNKILHDFQIQTILKPKAQFNQVIENMDKLVKDFSSQDYVIVLAGSNDFLNKRYPRVKPIADKIKKSLHTNIIFMTTPINYYSQPNRLQIYKFNLKFMEYIQKVDQKVPLNVSFVDVNSKNGLKPKDFVLASEISREVVRNKNLSKSLIFVDLKETVDRNCESISNQNVTSISSRSENNTYSNSSHKVHQSDTESSASSPVVQYSLSNTDGIYHHKETDTKQSSKRENFLYPRLSQITLD